MYLHNRADTIRVRSVVRVGVAAVDMGVPGGARWDIGCMGGIPLEDEIRPVAVAEFELIGDGT